MGLLRRLALTLLAVGLALPSAGQAVYPTQTYPYQSSNLSLFADFTSRTTGTTSIETIVTYTLPAGYLSTDGQAVYFVAAGMCAANANSKVIEVYFGATAVSTLTTTCNNAGWRTEGEIVRTSSTAQWSGSHIYLSTNTGGARSIALAESLGSAVDIRVRFTTASAAGDLTLKYFRVENHR